MKKMKKITIALLAVFFIGIANVSAQSDAKEVDSEVIYEKGDQKILMVPDKTTTEEVKEVKTCAKSGKVCDATCENKKKGTCCKGEKKKSCSKSEKAACSKSKAKCSKSEKGDFDYGTTNDYSGKKSSCSKKSKKSCKKSCSKKVKNCGADCVKPCCVPPPPKEDNSSKE